MTNAERRKEERRLEDERCVDGLLAETGFPDDVELRTLLLEMRNLRVVEVPQPSAELTALMGQPGPANVTRLEDWSRKHPRKKRVVFTTLAVAASLGVAGGAAAGNDTLRSQAQETISSVISSFLHPAPAPDLPSPATSSRAQPPEPAPAVVFPSPAGTLPVRHVPATPVPGSWAEPPASERHENSQAPGRERQTPEGVETGPPPVIPQTGEKPGGPGASRATDGPPPANERPADGAEAPGDGDANGKAGSDGGTGQDAGQPKILPPTQDGG